MTAIYIISVFSLSFMIALTIAEHRRNKRQKNDTSSNL